MIVPAYAKVNLTLDVLSRRADGYHEIASVLQTISLHDLLLVEPSDCRVFESTGLRVEGENLVLKAAKALEGHFGRAVPFRIRLHKRIPIGSGLGGGSSDAAAFLRMANITRRLGLSEDELVGMAASVGQDVPFFLHGGTALATGLGSTLESLPELSYPAYLVVVCPPYAASTREVYAAADGSRASARRTATLADQVRARRKIDQALLGNDLEPITLALLPPLDRLIGPLHADLPNLHMTGTGSAFFGLYDQIKAAEAALARLRSAGLVAGIHRPVGVSWA